LTQKEEKQLTMRRAQLIAVRHSLDSLGEDTKVKSARSGGRGANAKLETLLNQEGREPHKVL